MKTLIKITLIFTVLVSFYSCDKITYPYKIITDLDTNLYPGSFRDYPYPTFGENNNSTRNVLIEDFTGHKCAFCPAAATEAKNIAEANPGRVYIASIHASPNASGTSDFQAVSPDPNATKYTTDFTTPEGKEIAGHLSNIQGGVVGNPTGTINRTLNSNGEIFHGAGTWSSTTDSVLNTSLLVNIQAKTNYFPATRGLFIHTEVEFLQDLIGEYAIVIYAIENSRIDWQKVLSTDVEDYEHHDIHIGNVFAGESFGRVFVNAEVSTGAKFKNHFSYNVPAELDNTSMHFLAYVYDKSTEEILQVIKIEF